MFHRCVVRQSSEQLSPDDGGSSHIWNVGLLRRDCTALHPRRPSSSIRLNVHQILQSKSLILTHSNGETLAYSCIPCYLATWYVWSKLCLSHNWITQQAIWAYGEEVNFHTVLKSDLDEHEWSVSRSSRFAPGEIVPGTHYRGLWVGSVVGLYVVKGPRRGSNCDYAVPASHYINWATTLPVPPSRLLKFKRLYVTIPLHACMYVQLVRWDMSCGLEFFSTEVSAAPPKVMSHRTSCTYVRITPRSQQKTERRIVNMRFFAVQPIKFQKMKDKNVIISKLINQSWVAPIFNSSQH
jgi:hypothetical protein